LSLKAVNLFGRDSQRITGKAQLSKPAHAKIEYKIPSKFSGNALHIAKIACSAQA
jgi:hypothetical protein